MSWTSLLYTYGPFALLVFLAFPLERNAWNRVRHLRGRGVDATEKRIAYFAYFATWVAIFITCIVITVVWIFHNVIQGEATIKGRLVGIATEELRTTFSSLYLQRIYHQHGVAGVNWRIISPQRLPAGTEVDLVLDRSTGEHEDFTVYALRIADDFYAPGREVMLTYDRAKSRLTADRAELKVKQPDALITSSSSSASSSLSLWPANLGSALLDYVLTPLRAQEPTSLPRIAQQLEANDTIVRINARKELAQLGSKALPFIERTLTDRGSSYRLRLGVLVALNGMKAPALQPAAACAVVNAARDSDSTIQRYAQSYLAKNPQTGCRAADKPR
jgi:hypothetical protein